VLNIYELAALVVFRAARFQDGRARGCKAAVAVTAAVPRPVGSWWGEQRRGGAVGAGGRVTSSGGPGVPRLVAVQDESR